MKIVAALLFACLVVSPAFGHEKSAPDKSSYHSASVHHKKQIHKKKKKTPPPPRHLFGAAAPVFNTPATPLNSYILSRGTASTPLSSDDWLLLVQNGQTKKVAGNNVSGTPSLSNLQVFQGDGTSHAISTPLSTAIDLALGSTRGGILERGASGWVMIIPGTAGNCLTSNGPGSDPTYQSCGTSPGTTNCILISGTTTNCLLVAGTTTNALLVK